MVLKKKNNITGQLIVANPKVMLGKPVIKGTRITVELILERLSDGDTVDDILKSYPHITRAGVNAAIAYAKDVLTNDMVYPIAGSDR